MNNPLRPPDNAADDPRLGHLLGRRVNEGSPPRVILLGFPSDAGVRRNGGRPGAAAAPAELRRFLARLTPDPRAGPAFVDLLEHTADLGDVAVSADGDLEADQQLLAARVAEALEAGAFVIVLGGGHETAYGHFLGYVRARRKVAILNWDAHPDVRELKNARGHSGSPFRQALQHPDGMCAGYRVAGLLPQSSAAAHVAFVEAAGGEVIWRDELDADGVTALYDKLDGPTLVTFDIDAVDQASAPGVSAPAVGGMSSQLWLAAAYEAGRNPHVTSCDLVEMNPNYDRDGQTARLGAMTLWQILRGLAARGTAAPRRRGKARR
jgi:formiminoglutamase